MVLAQICVFQLIHCYTTQGPKHIGCPRQIILYQISILFARIPFRMCPTNKAERRRHENKTFPIRFRTNFRIDLFSLGSLLLDVGTKGWAVWFSLKLWVISYFHILIYKIAWYIYMHICTCAYTYCLTTKTVGFDYFGMFSNPYTIKRVSSLKLQIHVSIDHKLNNFIKIYVYLLTNNHITWRTSQLSHCMLCICSTIS